MCGDSDGNLDFADPAKEKCQFVCVGYTNKQPWRVNKDLIYCPNSLFSSSYVFKMTHFVVFTYHINYESNYVHPEYAYKIQATGC